MNQSNSNHGIRFSLRGLLAAIAFFAVACAALKFANSAWWIAVSSAALLLLMAMAVVAFVGRGSSRAFAIGFVVCGLLYGSLCYLSGRNELYPSSGQLPTTKLMRPVVLALVDAPNTPAWDIPVNGRLVRPATGSASGTGTGGGRGSGRGGGSGGLYATVRPDAYDTRLIAVVRPPQGITYTVHGETEVLMSIAHLLWAVIFGFLGGQFAVFVYARSRQKTVPDDQATQQR